jgi:hypothetical protein
MLKKRWLSQKTTMGKKTNPSRSLKKPKGKDKEDDALPG